MGYAIRDDGRGWRSVDSAKDCLDGEFFSDTLPDTPSAAALQESANSEARAYLAATDWYVIRQQETGEPVPEGGNQFFRLKVTEP